MHSVDLKVLSKRCSLSIIVNSMRNLKGIFNVMSLINICRCRLLLSLNIGSDSRTATPANYSFPYIEDNMLNKLLSIFLFWLLNRESKIRACPWTSFIFTKNFQVNLKDTSEGHCVLVSNWVLMMTTLACLTTLQSWLVSLILTLI